VHDQSAEKWSLCIGRWRGVQIRLHVLFPLLALALLLAVNSGAVNAEKTTCAFSVLFVSVALHELVRIITAARVGGHTKAIVLAPPGGWTRLHLPVDPPAHLVTALAGPLTFFVLMVVAACGLALAGDRNVLRLLESPCAPEISRIGSEVTMLQLVGQCVVWINWCLFLISLLPIDPCAGAELLRGILWPIVGRATAAVAVSHVALGFAVFAAVLATLLASILPSDSAHQLVSAPPSDSLYRLVPTWFPCAVAAVFLFFGITGRSQDKQYDSGLAIDELDSDDEEWLLSEWLDDDREAVLVEHPRDKQQETLDRKRREREASEDAHVDAILARMNLVRFDQLSEEDRAILKRASRRYRQRRRPRIDDQ